MISRSGRIGELREKDGNSPSNLNNASFYMIEMDLLRELVALRTPARLDVERPFYDFGKHVFPAMLGQLPGFTLSRRPLRWGIEYDGAWFDVGQKRDYLDVNRRLLDGEFEVELPYTKCDWGFRQPTTFLQNIESATLTGGASNSFDVLGLLLTSPFLSTNILNVSKLLQDLRGKQGGWDSDLETRHSQRAAGLFPGGVGLDAPI
jgi:hypothetical protein